MGRRRGCGGTFPRRGTHARCSCPCLQRSALACAGSRHRPPRSPKPERAEEVLPAGFSTSSARALACPSHCGQCAAKSLEHRCTVLVISYLWSVWGSRLRGFQCKNLAVGQHHTAPEPRTTPLSSRTVGHPEERRATCAGRGPTPGGWKREMIDGRGGSRGGAGLEAPAWKEAVEPARLRHFTGSSRSVLVTTHRRAATTPWPTTTPR